jgi:hypothetical protein
LSIVDCGLLVAWTFCEGNVITRYAIAGVAVGLPAIGLQAVAYQAAASLAAGRPAPILGMDALYVAMIGSGLSTLLMVGALGLYAKAKGQSVFLGLLGALSCIGLLVVALLPDKTRR